MGQFGLTQTFQAQKTPYTYMYMGVGYNAIIDSALIFISASPSVTPCHGHTKNRMQYYAIIYNYKFGCIIVWRPLIIELEKKQQLFWNQEGKKLHNHAFEEK